MTPEETRQAAAVMIAHAEGKRIEFKRKTQPEWLPCAEPTFDWHGFDYRVAPERWSGKIWVHPDGEVREWKAQDHIAAIEGQGWRLIEAKEVEP